MKILKAKPLIYKVESIDFDCPKINLRYNKSYICNERWIPTTCRQGYIADYNKKTEILQFFSDWRKNVMIFRMDKKEFSRVMTTTMLINALGKEHFPQFGENYIWLKKNYNKKIEELNKTKNFIELSKKTTVRKTIDEDHWNLSMTYIEDKKNNHEGYRGHIVGYDEKGYAIFKEYYADTTERSLIKVPSTKKQYVKMFRDFFGWKPDWR